MLEMPTISRATENVKPAPIIARRNESPKSVSNGFEYRYRKPKNLHLVHRNRFQLVAILLSSLLYMRCIYKAVLSNARIVPTPMSAEPSYKTRQHRPESIWRVKKTHLFVNWRPRSRIQSFCFSSSTQVESCVVDSDGHQHKSKDDDNGTCKDATNHNCDDPDDTFNRVFQIRSNRAIDGGKICSESIQDSSKWHGIDPSKGCSENGEHHLFEESPTATPSERVHV